MKFGVHQIRRMFIAVVASALLLSTVAIGLGATADTADAAPSLSCTRSGDTIAWTPTNTRILVRGYDSVADADSVWLATVVGADNSYEISDFDTERADGDRYFIRYGFAGEIFDVPCTIGIAAAPGAIVCTHDGTELAWDQIDVGNDIFHVRQINADGTSTWVSSIDAANPNTYSGVSADGDYLVRYRVRSEGVTTVFDVHCN